VLCYCEFEVASDIKLVFYSSTITMMHGPINIRLFALFVNTYWLIHWFVDGLEFESSVMVVYAHQDTSTKETKICENKRYWFNLARLQHYEKRRLASSCLTLCPSVHSSAWNNSAPTRWIFMKFYIWVFFNNLFRKLKFH